MGIGLYRESGVIDLSGNNFTDCGSGLYLQYLSDATVSGLDLSLFSIPATRL